MDTPPKVFESGNASAGLELGPILAPNREKSDPRAMDPPGKPGAIKLAAFTTPRRKIVGCPNRPPTNTNPRNDPPNMRIAAFRQYVIGFADSSRSASGGSPCGSLAIDHRR